MIRPHEDTAIARAALVTRVKRRALLRIGFLASAALAVAELAGAVPSFVRVLKIEGLGGQIAAGNKADVLAAFKSTNDTPILNLVGRFFLIHPAGAIAAAYRKCVHLGCAVPFNASEDRFHCVCHQSVYDKRTALKREGPAPRGLDLFHVAEVNGALVVNTNPLQVMRRDDNHWHAEHVEVLDT
jgi:cytochrome b6-f complex iron-sulfur subunit